MKKLLGFVGVLTFIAAASMALAQVSVGGIQWPAFMPDGTAAQGSLCFGSEPTTCLWRATTQEMDISIIGTSRHAFTASRYGQTTGNLIIWTNSTTNPSTTAQLSIGNTAAATSGLRILSGTTPTQSGTTCGTGPTLTGDNTNGSVALGSAPGLPCTIVFNGTWAAAPHCSLNPEILTTGTTTVRATSITTTGFVITSTASLVQADKVTWFCVSE